MQRIFRLILPGLLIAGCGGRRDGVTPNADRPTAAATALAVRFTLCHAGLPDTGNWKCDPLLVDLVPGSPLELVAFARLGDGPRIWRYLGGCRWEERRAGVQFEGRKSCGGGLALADVNGDGQADLVVADHCEGLFVFLREGDGFRVGVQSLFHEPIVRPGDDKTMYIGVEDVAVGDVNGDGHADLVACSSDSGGIYVYAGDSSGTNWTWLPTSLPNRGWGNRIALADVNGDGRLDVVCTYNEGPRVWLGDGRGGFEAASVGLPSPPIYGLFHGLQVRDVNEDGRLDLVVANWVDGPEVYLQREDGVWLKQPDVFPELLGGAVGVAVGDVDRDGHVDLAVTGRRLDPEKVGFVYGVFILRGNGTGTGWRWLRDTGLPDVGLPFNWGAELADFDGDGLLDLVVGSGGIVATSLEYDQPIFNAGLLVWRAQLANSR